MDYSQAILDKLEEELHDKVWEIFDSYNFKMKRNHYHFQNIKKIVQDTNILEVEDFYTAINLPIYFEMESFLVSTRSTVDILMHLLNSIYNLQLKDVYISNVFKHPSLPSEVRNVLKKYTRNFDNATWTFIYTSRNEIVHEKSIPHILPVNVDPFQFESINLFFKWEDIDRELISFFNQCLKFLTNFSQQLFSNILISI